MKNILKISLVISSILIIQGCYTQFAATKTIYIEEPPEKYVIEQTRITKDVELDSLQNEAQEVEVIIKEYHYWAYQPVFGFDPFYDYADINILIYPRLHRYWDPWYYSYYDPYWSYNYGWYYYDPYPWNYSWHGYHYGHHNYYWQHRPYHNYYSWPWYASANDGLPVKKRDWDRRSAGSRNEPIVRNPNSQNMVTQAVPDNQFAIRQENGGVQVHTRTVDRGTRLEQNDTDESRTVTKRTPSSSSNRRQSTTTVFASGTTSELIKLISTRIRGRGSEPSRSEVKRSRQEKSSTGSGSSIKNKRSSDSKTKSSSSSGKSRVSNSREKKSSASSQSNSGRSKNDSKKSSSSKRSRR